MNFCFAGNMCQWQMGQVTILKFSIELAANTDDPKASDRQSQPETSRPIWIRHACVLPLPSVTFQVFETIFDPTTHTIPCDRSIFWRQVSQNNPSFEMFCTPPSQKSPFDRVDCKTGYLSRPDRTWTWKQLRHMSEVSYSFRAVLATQVNA